LLQQKHFHKITNLHISAKVPEYRGAGCYCNNKKVATNHAKNASCPITTHKTICWQAILFFHKLYFFNLKRHASNQARAGLNECKAPGKVVTAGTPKRFAQLRSVTHALVSTFPKQLSKMSKLIRFRSLQRRLGSCQKAAVCDHLKLFKQKVVSQQNRLLCYGDTIQQLFAKESTDFWTA